jgi:hypothetical protein
MMRNQVSSDSGAWVKPVSDLLATLESSEQVSSSCDSCRFHEKSSIYIVLADLVPEGALKEAVLTSYIDFLARDRMQADNPVEWLAQLRSVLKLTRSLSRSDRETVKTLRDKGLFPTMLPGVHANDLLLKLQASRNPVISAYAYKEILAPSAVDVPVAPK